MTTPIRTGSVAPPPVQRPEAVRAAQRAFFQAAQTAVAPTAAKPTVTPAPQETRIEAGGVAKAASSTPTGERWARPGSRLDITV